MSAPIRQDLPESRRRHLRLWLASGALLTFVILVVGGITRLTQSGLSIVDWNPIVGVVPPLGEADWMEAFGRYQEYPEYRKLRQGMTLEEFKVIFLWEYAHRLAARLIGVVFLVPFLYFWTRGYFDRPLLRRVLVLFALGAAQGFMGWFMVSSGLVDRPSVSHYRLASHLSFALAILGLCAWLAWELRPVAGDGEVEGRSARAGARRVYLLGGLLAAQILWGAFVAGLDAGLYYGTFPRMGGGWVPPGAWALDPPLRNLLENPATVQWVHRVLGTALAAAAVLAAAAAWRAADPGPRRLSGAFAVLVLAQYGLGVLTLLRFVPVSLGALHQATAVVLFVVWLRWLHHVRRGAPSPPARADGAPPRARAAERGSPVPR